MIDHNIQEMSESEEMYLITIAQLVESGESGPIAISRLADEMSIQPVSANQMIHKLAEEGLVNYLPYKGVRLTVRGNKIASQVLRRRRLWEVFLVEHLGTPPDEADALACRLEHITPKFVIQQLDDFLGHPAFSSQGSPIPTDNNIEVGKAARSLAELAVGDTGQVVLLDANSMSNSFLDAAGLKLGTLVRPLAVTDEGHMLLSTDDQNIHLAREIVDSILVKPAVKTKR